MFGIQRELPGQIVVEANFIRANGYDLPVSRNLNFVPRQFLGDNPTTDAAANTFLSATIPNPFRNLVPGGSAFNTATTITRAQSLLAFPQFTNLWVQEYNGSNRYKSLQLQINKRFATDVTMNCDVHLFEPAREDRLSESLRHGAGRSHLCSLIDRIASRLRVSMNCRSDADVCWATT